MSGPSYLNSVNLKQDSDFPYLVLAPGMIIMLTVFSLNMIGDGLRDALDPRLKGR